MEWLWAWLKQPSTLRVLNLLVGAIGFKLSPENWELILNAVIAMYIVIDGFYNQQIRK